jgi:hypothetical protein
MQSCMVMARFTSSTVRISVQPHPREMRRYCVSVHKAISLQVLSLVDTPAWILTLLCVIFSPIV